MTISSVSLTNHTVLLPQSHDSSHHVSEAKYLPQPTHLLLLQRVDNADHLVSQKWPGNIPLIFPLLMHEGSASILALPSLWLQKHTDPRAHNFVHPPHFWHEPRFTNCRYAWSQRLYGITQTIHGTHPCTKKFSILLPKKMVGWWYCQ